jgi:hypothetical protein
MDEEEELEEETEDEADGGNKPMRKTTMPVLQLLKATWTWTGSHVIISTCTRTG